MKAPISPSRKHKLNLSTSTYRIREMSSEEAGALEQNYFIRETYTMWAENVCAFKLEVFHWEQQKGWQEGPFIVLELLSQWLATPGDFNITIKKKPSFSAVLQLGAPEPCATAGQADVVTCDMADILHTHCCRRIHNSFIHCAANISLLREKYLFLRKIGWAEHVTKYTKTFSSESAVL